MSYTHAQSSKASAALELVEDLQQRFVAALERLAGSQCFQAVHWRRDEGRHGGGMRLEAGEEGMFNRASVNVSQVHYDDDPARRLGSATALSTIIHPAHPLAPSVHIHISYTELKSGDGYWRIMADLNPAIEDASSRDRFRQTLQAAAPTHFEEAMAQGERYFFIPALGRHRGVAHFYLEQFTSGDFSADLALARAVGEAAIDGYVAILADILPGATPPSAAQLQAQLAYHTLYFFQVLTLDRGTTAGLLVHDQNDIGILGSLPARIDRALLATWRKRLPKPQDALLDALLSVLPKTSPTPIDQTAKARLAHVVRQHYRAHPEALKLQATGNTTPATVQQHNAG
ncbi:MAG: coproporphyrinogen III oxidase [Zetaproteobacteria bacterium]|nr:MAG: coproporphyrinogen III oxidase [Zetaproteobacteria bacterium]